MHLLYIVWLFVLRTTVIAWILTVSLLFFVVCFSILFTPLSLISKLKRIIISPFCHYLPQPPPSSWKNLNLDRLLAAEERAAAGWYRTIIASDTRDCENSDLRCPPDRRRPKGDGIYDFAFVKRVHFSPQCSCSSIDRDTGS